MEDGHRVMWSEMRDADQNDSLELYYLIGEKTPNGWEFFERSCYEMCWYPIPSRAALVKKAVMELNGAREESQKTRAAMRQAA